MRSIANFIIGVAETHLRLRPLQKQSHEIWSYEVKLIPLSLSLSPFYRLTGTVPHKLPHVKLVYRITSCYLCVPQ